MDFERWVWTELIAFDHRQADSGAAEYLESLGFVPYGMCLLVSAPDFVLQHTGMEREIAMPPDVCSRDAHPGNEVRARQPWTNWQIRTLVQELTRAGCRVYLSFFNVYHQNKYHREWVSDHQEALQVWSYYGRGLNINPLARLADGSLLEDYFIPQTVKACVDYGFAGWHGPDGFGPLSSGDIHGTDVSDPIIAQLLETVKWPDVPKFMTQPCLDDKKLLQKRQAWLYRHRHREWIAFWVDRWAGFWAKMNRALHAEGKRSIINSAWTKSSFEALYCYGIDYRKMAATGIDYMVVEAVALGIKQTRPETHKHYNYAATLQEIRAHVPEIKLIFLHGIKDVVEDFDNLHHATPAFERELYTLANRYYHDGRRLRRAADGLLACLADGISASEWQFIKARWAASFADEPVRAGQVTALWCDEQLYGGLEDYLRDGFWSSHWQMTALMEQGVQLQTTARLEYFAAVDTPAFFVASAHLVAPERLQQLIAAGKPVILCGRADALAAHLGQAAAITDGRMTLAILNTPEKPSLQDIAPGRKKFRPQTGNVYFIDEISRMDIAAAFFAAAAELINRVLATEMSRQKALFATPVDRHDDFNLDTRIVAPEIIDVALENIAPDGRIVKTVRISHPVEKIAILSSFPLRPKEDHPDDQTFSFVIPPRGIAVARFHCRQENK